MEKSFSESYKAAGVDITAGYAAVELMKQHVARTMTPGAIGGLGGFGGLFELDMTGLEHPVLVSGTDGVGTKLKLAILMDKHNTVGIDGVAMCVNDIITCGAKPLIFLDYIACGKVMPEKVAAIVSGVAEGCVQAGAAIIALPSSGVHSNGFSLVRRVFDINEKTVWHYEADLGKSLGEALLVPTRIYVKPVLALLEKVPVYAICHITGGGFYENLPRALADGCVARIEKAKLRTPAIFELIRKTGNISEHDMYNTFNMGVGMAVVVPAEHADAALAVLRENGEDAYFIGEVAEGAEKGVELW